MLAFVIIVVMLRSSYLLIVFFLCNIEVFPMKLVDLIEKKNLYQLDIYE